MDKISSSVYYNHLDLISFDMYTLALDHVLKYTSVWDFYSFIIVHISHKYTHT